VRHFFALRVLLIFFKFQIMNVKFFFVAGLFSTFASLLEALTDPARYAITYCHLVKDTDAYQRYKLKTMCRHKVQIFGERVK
jgi:hypothetical protein